MNLLDEGAFSTTYKYALLLALIDVCMEKTGSQGQAPEAISEHLERPALLGYAYLLLILVLSIGLPILFILGLFHQRDGRVHSAHPEARLSRSSPWQRCSCGRSGCGSPRP